ncbi:clc-like domain-containing protein [Ditylenchus destructor]|uniref:Clc-like domain-containing protein n=1 Tax=Ditylenchus destructor TaxID=166010 RepID=A0AAD4N4J2_9BILA|nr:clc-like domain-containing protein [Ditylenchus destructor]
MFELTSRLAKLQIITVLLTAISNFFVFIAVLTPSWQVAEDTDVGRSIQSGLWIYCPGASQCWYIFSDDLINYYERVDVCRFFLIGDCRKKLLRTPYFFGWHYAVLILLLVCLLLSTAAQVSICVAYFKPKLCRIGTIVLDATLTFAFLLLCIGLTVFMINAEMLESRYLIGVKNTFEKQYGYSFYLACVGLTVMLFALMGALLISTSVFFMSPDANASRSLFPGQRSHDRTNDYILQSEQNRRYKMMHEAPVVTEFGVRSSPIARYSPSESSIPTRTFLSY